MLLHVSGMPVFKILLLAFSRTDWEKPWLLTLKQCWVIDIMSYCWFVTSSIDFKAAIAIHCSLAFKGMLTVCTCMNHVTTYLLMLHVRSGKAWYCQYGCTFVFTEWRCEAKHNWDSDMLCLLKNLSSGNIVTSGWSRLKPNMVGMLVFFLFRRQT